MKTQEMQLLWLAGMMVNYSSSLGTIRPGIENNDAQLADIKCCSNIQHIVPCCDCGIYLWLCCTCSGFYSVLLVVKHLVKLAQLSVL